MPTLILPLYGRVPPFPFEEEITSSRGEDLQQEFR
jgi:hypothetical protein